jgi:hypothetical protein
MDYKICNKCSDTLAATTEYFYADKNAKYGVKAVCKKCIAEGFKKKYIPVCKKTEKQCNKCKEVFPLTGEYFYTKTTKKGTIIKGKPLSKDSTSFSSVCKKCDIVESLLRYRKKLMIKYNVSTDKELDEIINAKLKIKSDKLKNKALKGKPKSLRKYDYPENITRKEMDRIRIIKDMGYEPETYDIEWKKRWLEKAKASRKYTYPDGYDKIPQALRNKMQIENLTDAYIANRLGFKLNDIPSEILEIKRKQLKFYRHVKSKKDQIRNNK